MTPMFFLEIPSNRWDDFLELEDRFFGKILAHFASGGKMARWVDTNNPLRNTVTGNYAYPFPVQFTKAQMKNFADRLDLSSAKIQWLKDHLAKLDMEDATWFPEILEDISMASARISVGDYEDSYSLEYEKAIHPPQPDKVVVAKQWLSTRAKIYIAIAVATIASAVASILYFL